MHTLTPSGNGNGRRAVPRQSPPSGARRVSAGSLTTTFSAITRHSYTAGLRSMIPPCSGRSGNWCGWASGISWAAGTSSPTAICPAARRSSARSPRDGATSGRSSASNPQPPSTSIRSVIRGDWCRYLPARGTTAIYSAARTRGSAICRLRRSAGSAMTARLSSRSAHRPGTARRWGMP